MNAPLERAVAILNPAAGGGAAPSAWSAAERVLRAAGASVRVLATPAPGHAAALAEAAVAEGCSAVVAVGGDGTISEVANGLLRARKGGAAPPPLGIIPAGSGNDFVKQLDIPADPTAAARALLTSTPRRVDAGRMGERFFVNGVGIGLDAQVAREAAGIRRLRGVALYGLALLRALRSYRPLRLRVVLDGVPVADGPVTLVTVANGPCCGGGFWLCPAARLDDGEIDVLIADPFPRMGVLRFLLRSLRGGHVGFPGILLRRARRVEIIGEGPLPVHVDGELLDPAPDRLEIEIVPGCLPVLAP